MAKGGEEVSRDASAKSVAPANDAILRRTFEYRLYPSPAQERRLEATLDACRFVYNWAVADRRNMWAYAKCSTSEYDQAGYLKHLRQDNPFLKDVHIHPLRNTIRRVYWGFEKFFRGRKAGRSVNRPRFRSAKRYKSFTFFDWGNGCKIDGRRLWLSKIGRLCVRWHRPVEGKVKTCTIKREPDGWYVQLCAELPRPEAIPESTPVGLDLGLDPFLTLSDGTKIENPRYLRKAQGGICKSQRMLSRRQLNSSRRRKTANTLARKHLHVRRARRDFHWKTASILVKQFNPIVTEHLDIKQLLSIKYKNPLHLRRGIRDAAWGLFLDRLSCKAESAGTRVIRVEPRGTSQACSQCGETVPKKLSDRIHRCPYCGLRLDRDVNAAKNILRKGLGRSLRGVAPIGATMNREAAGHKPQQSVTPAVYQSTERRVG